MDAHLTFEAHIKQLCKNSFYHLRNIAKLHPTLTLSDAEKLVHAFVSSRLDYCNALLIGIPNKSIQKLQYIQNSAARILMRVRKYDHITPILKALHWLPVELRIEFKVSVLSHQCVHGTAPQGTPHPPYLLADHPLQQLQPPRTRQDQAPYYGRPGLLLGCSQSVECSPRPHKSTTDRGSF
ncbi:hypothetical protein OYC64_020208 [Pagothenia borchgrevinki]|uniref:Uncharacterized protein n=1 Tax=Pagothenia borchgrevinki TaxID=8213 RepID=A0ABD2FKD8_PAGBO